MIDFEVLNIFFIIVPKKLLLLFWNCCYANMKEVLLKVDKYLRRLSLKTCILRRIFWLRKYLTVSVCVERFRISLYVSCIIKEFKKRE